jgi:hypothetical protein
MELTNLKCYVRTPYEKVTTSECPEPINSFSNLSYFTGWKYFIQTAKPAREKIKTNKKWPN